MDRACPAAPRTLDSDAKEQIAGPGLLLADWVDAVLDLGSVPLPFDEMTDVSCRGHPYTRTRCTGVPSTPTHAPSPLERLGNTSEASCSRLLVSHVIPADGPRGAGAGTARVAEVSAGTRVHGGNEDKSITIDPLMHVSRWLCRCQHCRREVSRPPPDPAGRRTRLTAAL